MSSLHQALKLLRDDNLVWADEFEAIRHPLADLLDHVGQLPTHQFDEFVDELVISLLSEHPHSTHVSTTDPVERWMDDATRQLGIIEEVASRSERSKLAIQRMFGAL